MLTVVGLDLSLVATGVSVLDSSGVPATRTITGLKKAEPIRRMHQLIADVVDWTDYQCPNLIVIESPSFGHAGERGFHERGGQWWATLSELWTMNYVLAVVPPTTLKQYATGSGRSDKAAMIEATKGVCPEFTGDDNQADAFWLAHMGMAHLGHPISRTAVQTSALAKATWDWTGKFAPAAIRRKKTT